MSMCIIYLVLALPLAMQIAIIHSSLELEWEMHFKGQLLLLNASAIVFYITTRAVFVYTTLKLAALT